MISYIKFIDLPTEILNAINKNKTKNCMIVIPVKDGENIERALKRFKRKIEKTGVVKELRLRQAFEKPSITRRTEIKKAIYIEDLQRTEE